jgi:soluble lytic murein transglycosylase-like protein
MLPRTWCEGWGRVRIEKMRSGAAFILVTALLCAPRGARADISRYVDRDGVEHYTNYTPSGSGWQRIYRGRKTPPPMRTRGGPIVVNDPARLRAYDAHIREASALYVLPEELIRAVMHVESNFNPRAVSRKGALGLMQLMPGTAAEMGVTDPFDPRQNVLGGVRLLRILANRFQGDTALTLAAYNAGEAAVLKYRGIPPYAETQRYVRRVQSHFARYRAAREPQPQSKDALAQR